MFHKSCVKNKESCVWLYALNAGANVLHLKVLALAVASLVASHTVLAADAAAPPAGPGSLAGLWVKTGFKDLALASLQTPDRDKVQRTSTGEWPPLQPWAEADVRMRIRKSQEGDPIPTTLTHCLPGIPLQLLGAGPYPVQILETPGQVTMLFEELNHFRAIYLNRQQPKDPDPAYMGHSVGHWEGATLVVDTIALVKDTPLDWLGTPHSEDLHLIERYRRTGKDTLELTLTIDDPRTFTRRWETRQYFKAAPADATLVEYICDNNRDAPE
jgi:hypothetical protein